MRRMQSVVNAAARLIFNLRRSEYVSTHSSAFTGSVFRHASGTRLPSWYTRSSTAVHRRTLARSPTLPSRPSKSPRTSLFLRRLPRSASGSPLHCWQPSIFGGWLSGVELSASEGYVGVISDSLPHSTRDISLH